MNHRLSSTCKKFHNIFRISTRTCFKVPAVPVAPLVNPKQEGEKVKVNQSTLNLLERLSLVKSDTAEGVTVLEDSIAFADKIIHINTDGVKPLYTVLEDENLMLRSDEITQGNCQKAILKNASIVEDEYFVAPQGNIPLHEVEPEEKQLQQNRK